MFLFYFFFSFKSKIHLLIIDQNYNKYNKYFMKILTVGNLGYVGIPLIKLLKKENFHITGLDTNWFYFNDYSYSII